MLSFKLTDRVPFGQAMYLIYALSVFTNCCIAVILIYASAFKVLVSPILAIVITTICMVLYAKERITVKQTFIITAYTVALEVVVHTHYLGWDTGFYYFLYGLSIVFLLDFSWSKRLVFLFNGSVIIVLILMAIFYKGGTGVYTLSDPFVNNLRDFNQVIVGSVILMIVLYFSHNNKKNDEALSDANDELQEQNQEILEQRNHLSILLKEVHHRVKNNLQIINSLLSLQQKSIKDEHIYAILNESKSRVEAIALIHHNLYNSNQGNQGNQVDFDAYLNELVKSQEIIQSNIKTTINSINVIINLDTAVPLGLIISEMITNSVKYAFSDVENPEIEISFANRSNNYELIYRDNGTGLPDNFDLNSNSTLGVEIITALITQIDGTISYKNDGGAMFEISF